MLRRMLVQTLVSILILAALVFLPTGTIAIAWARGWVL
jgi:hypothetical protein